MTIDRNHILKLADLANLTLSEEEIDDYISDTNKILKLFEEIRDIDTTGVKPLSNVLEQFEKLYRPYTTYCEITKNMCYHKI